MADYILIVSYALRLSGHTTDPTYYPNPHRGTPAMDTANNLVDTYTYRNHGESWLGYIYLRVIEQAA
jgi:hypothetical protein